MENKLFLKQFQREPSSVWTRAALVGQGEFFLHSYLVFKRKPQNISVRTYFQKCLPEGQGQQPRPETPTTLPQDIISLCYSTAECMSILISSYKSVESILGTKASKQILLTNLPN